MKYKPSFKDGALPVIPLTFTEAFPYEQTYIDAVEKSSVDERTRAVALHVVRASVEDRREAALDERRLVMDNPRVMEEYGRVFGPLDASEYTTPPQRVSAFALEALELPSYEIFARLALRDEPDVYSAEMAMRVFGLLKAEFEEGSYDIESAQPDARLTIDGLYPERRPFSHAVVSTKVTGLVLTDHETGRIIEAKTRRKGVIDLEKSPRWVQDSFVALTNRDSIVVGEGDPYNIEADIENRYRALVKFMSDRQADVYQPIIDRGYLALLKHEAPSDIYAIDPAEREIQGLLVGLESDQSDT